jgi:cytosine/adenosine deaminase-related metal-dependent hydrolase
MLNECLEPMAPLLGELSKNGLLGSDNIFNHCTSLPDDAWRLLADAGVNITVDPGSDAHYGLAGGLFTYQSAIDHGLRPGIGTDLETAYGGDMFTEMRVAFSLQRAIAQSPRHAGDAAAPASVTVRQVLEAATIDGARCAGLEDRTDSLIPGKQADLTLIKTDTVSLFPSNNAIATVVHAVDRAEIEAVMVASRFRKLNGALLDVNLTRIRRLAEDSLAYLFKAAGYTPNILEDSFPKLAGEKPQAWTGR